MAVGIENFEDLANAVVEQAAKDYLQCKKDLYMYGDMYSLRNRITDCVLFFRSDWFRFLTDLDGEIILSRLDRMYKQWEKEFKWV